jgi:hypothetical protein
MSGKGEGNKVMNIRRGLFRAWVGLSLIWACLIGLIFFADAQKYLQPIRLTVADSKFEFPGTTARSTVRAALVTFFKQEKLKGQGSKAPLQMNPEEDAAEISQKFTSRDFPEFVLQASALLISVPLVFFVLGALLLWIGAGFRRSSGPSATR